ncbi:unnamed protein product [Larinioides sclopetarius]|uniref:EGF-like domain-containing protein n=1 Tax=Larinioides sclopetarius TaxID=280406 RepID=A0AAV1YYQ7_9ARAC
MLSIRKQILLLVVNTFFVYVMSASTYNIDDHETQNAAAVCACTNGKCVNEGGKDVCKCLPGYGNYTKSDCRACECGPNKSCIWKQTGWFSNEKICFCKSGYHEENGICVDNCEPDPCKNDGTCEKDGDGFKCLCKGNWIGRRCEENNCEPNPCRNDGTCEKDADVFKCTCYGNWMGTTCEKKDPCFPNPCKNGGKCWTEGEGYKCDCKPSFLGRYCEEDNPCFPNPCKNGGKCWTEGEGYICECQPSFLGRNCEKDPCFPNPCKNGGKCWTEGEGYICECQPSFLGRNCEKVLFDPCASHPCQNGGACLIDGESFKCKCKPAFFGINCEKEINLCISNTCQNEGICIQKGNSISCHCKPPYFGAVCEKDPCTENPCENGGTCVQVGYSFKCKCHHPFSGDTCQYDACSDNPCFNGGTCARDGNSFKCKCRNGYYGTICEKEGYESTLKETTQSTSELNNTSISITEEATESTLELNNTSISTTEDVRNITFVIYTDTTNEFTNSTQNFNFNSTTTKPEICTRDMDCLNGGACKNSNCECPPNFEGYWCEKNLLCEKLQPTCRAMGATCKNVGFNAICECPPDKMYHPRSGMCEDICDSWKCGHGRCEIDGRAYKCICDTGYTGDHCNKTLDKEAKIERFNAWLPVMTSVMAFMCLLLMVQLCLSCRNRKFSSHTSPPF